MNLSEKWLRGKSACSEGLEWFKAQDETDGVKVVELTNLGNRGILLVS